MPPKRAAAESKAESPSRRKVGRPKKVEPEEAEDVVEEAEEEEEEPAPVKRRGRPKRAKAAAASALIASVAADEDEEDVTTITLNIDDLVDLPSEVFTPPSPKKRKAPTKSSASKKSKSDTSLGSKDFGGAGDSNENLIQCSLCDARVVQLVRHIRAQHGDDPDYDVKIKEARALEAKVQSSTPRKAASSNLLDDLTLTISKMEKVTPIVDRRTTGERGNSLVRPKNTQCPICEKVVRRYDLNKHIRNVHSGEKPNKCPYCEYASPWKGNLNTHIAGVHTKARLHDCIRCGLSFKTRSAMIGHVRKVHDKMYQPKERLFECEECNKKFYKKFHLQRHIRVHTGEKPFTCAFCEKTFASKTNMDSHIQSVHLKIKPFKCGYCEKGFARKKMMLVHIRKYHMNKDDNSLGLAGLDDIDDITLDDNMDNVSEASLESGEIMAGEEDAGMVLIKMREDGTGEASEGVKQYMFVPADQLPDDDLDDTLNTTTGIDQSVDASQSLSLDESSALAAETETTGESVTGVGASTSGTDKSAGAPAKQPTIINVKRGQVVQTGDGIMFVAQPAKITEHEGTEKEATAAAPAQEKEAEEIKKEETSTDTETNATPDAAGEPDLVQKALEQTVPEVTSVPDVTTVTTITTEASPSKATAILSSDAAADLVGGGGLPVNLLATEEGDQNETTNGEVETFFLADIQTNGTS